MSYSLVKSLFKGGKALLAFALPVAIAQVNIKDITIAELMIQLFPVLSTLTIGGLITILVDYLKHKNKGG